MSLYFVIIKKGEIVNTNNVTNVIRIIRSSRVLIITKYKDMLRKVTVYKFLIKETRFFYVAASTSLQVWTNFIPSFVKWSKNKKNKDQKVVCVKVCFLKCNSSVFIGDRRERDGPVNAIRSFITKGPSAYLGTSATKRSLFVLTLWKLIWFRLNWFGGKTSCYKFWIWIYFLNKTFL